MKTLLLYLEFGLFLILAVGSLLVWPLYDWLIAKMLNPPLDVCSIYVPYYRYGTN